MDSESVSAHRARYVSMGLSPMDARQGIPATAQIVLYVLSLSRQCALAKITRHGARGFRGRRARRPGHSARSIVATQRVAMVCPSVLHAARPGRPLDARGPRAAHAIRRGMLGHVWRMTAQSETRNGGRVSPPSRTAGSGTARHGAWYG